MSTHTKKQKEMASSEQESEIACCEASEDDGWIKKVSNTTNYFTGIMLQSLRCLAAVIEENKSQKLTSMSV